MEDTSHAMEKPLRFYLGIYSNENQKRARRSVSVLQSDTSTGRARSFHGFEGMFSNGRLHSLG